jgi:hypothetical protein
MGGTHQFAATASDLAFPANDTYDGAMPDAGYLQHGMSTLGNPAFETQLPSGVLPNTIDQPTLGSSNAGLSEPDLQHELIYGSRTNKSFDEGRIQAFPISETHMFHAKQVLISDFVNPSSI